MWAELQKLGANLVSGAYAVLRGDNTGALVVTGGHAKFYEAVRQGNVYQLSTATGGVTIDANNVFSAAATTPLVAVFNPPNSGMNVVILRGVHVWASGTAGAQGLVWAVAPAPCGITAASGTSPTSTLTGQTGGSVCRGYVDAAMTGITGNAIMSFAGGPTTGALAANANHTFVDEVAGAIWVPPGASGGLYAAAAGTSPIVAATMYWEEVPV